MPFSIKTMRSIDLSCVAPSSTAIVSNMEPTDTPRRSISRRLNSLFSYREHRGGDGDATPRVFDHSFTPRSSTSRLDGSRKSSVERSLFALPFTPRAAFFGREKNRKSSADAEQSRKSSVEESRKSRGSMIAAMMIRRRSSSDVYDLDSSPSSSRHLLRDMPDSRDSIVLVPSKPPARYNSTQLDLPSIKCSRSERVLGKPPAGSGDKMIRRDDCLRTSSFLDTQRRKSVGWFPSQLATPRLSSSKSARFKQPIDSPALASSASAQSNNQVVVLRVSLHCKGCEAKLRKHLSKMEGVTSFSIDLATKKVTIVGNVTPSEVLASISKVKNAQFWPSSPSSTPSLSSSSISSNSSTSTGDFSY